MQPLVIGVRFAKIGKIYHFDASKVPDVQKGDIVLVETSRGFQLGEVSQVIDKPPTIPENGLKLVERKATPRDLLSRQQWQAKEPDVVAASRARAEELRLSSIKIVGAEYSYDGARLTIFFCCDTEEKADIKSLRGDMQRRFSPSQIELRQIGPRDVAKQMCGMGACGLERQCCSQFLTDFSSISIRMAKEQGISLTPTEITGMCGRLRCCLVYEYDQYVQARNSLPKRNKLVRTPQGDGRVVDVIPLREMIAVEIPEIGVREFTKDEIEVIHDAAS